jgi:hypothetical protein
MPPVIPDAQAHQIVGSHMPVIAPGNFMKSGLYILIEIVQNITFYY